MKCIETVKSYLILLLICGLLISLSYIMLKRERVYSNPASSSSISIDIDHRWKDTSGIEHAVIAQQIERETRTVTQPIISKIDSIMKGNVNPDQVTGFQSVSFISSQDSIKFLTRTIDSLKRVTYFYKDKYLSATFRTSYDSCKSCETDFDFSYNADLNFVDYYKKRKILGMRIGKKDFYTDISSSDKRLKIKGVEKFTVERNTPPFGFRLQALATYNTDRDFSAGLGVRFDAGSNFNMGVNYSWNFSQERWNTVFYTKYDILQFGR